MAEIHSGSFSFSKFEYCDVNYVVCFLIALILKNGRENGSKMKSSLAKSKHKIRLRNRTINISPTLFNISPTLSSGVWIR